MTLTGCLWSSAFSFRVRRMCLTAVWPDWLVRTDISRRTLAFGSPPCDRLSGLSFAGGLLDELRNDERTHRQEHDHGRAHDHEPDQVFGEVGDAVQRDGRVARLHDHAASRTPDDLVAGPQRQFDRAHRALVAADPRLRARTGPDRGRGGSCSPGARRADRLAVAVATFLAALLAHRVFKFRSSE